MPLITNPPAVPMPTPTPEPIPILVDTPRTSLMSAWVLVLPDAANTDVATEAGFGVLYHAHDLTTDAPLLVGVSLYYNKANQRTLTIGDIDLVGVPVADIICTVRPN